MRQPLGRAVRASLCVLLLACLALAGCSPAARPGGSSGPGAREETSPASPAAVSRTIEAAALSAGYLVQAVGEDGRFAYLVNMNPDVEVADDYNILRHAGTIYSMAQYYALEPDPAVLEAMLRAGAYLRDEALGPVPDGEDMLAVWSDPAEDRDIPEQAKLGGAGLGLVALCSIEQARPGFTPLEDLRKLGRFITYLQKDDGSYHSKYIPSAGGRQDEWISLYYPGEAALGLAMLHELDTEGGWLEPAARSIEYLALEREGQAEVPADHWVLLATDTIFHEAGPDELPVSRELFFSHALRISEGMLAEQIVDPGKPVLYGGFTRDGRTTPTSTRLEGLQAVLGFLPEDHERRPAIESAVERGISFLLRSQVTEGEFAGAFPRSVRRMQGDSEEAREFNEEATEVRIDYVQHALSALVANIRLETAE